MKRVTDRIPRDSLPALVLLALATMAMGCQDDVVLGWKVSDMTLDGGQDGGADTGADAGDQDDDPGPKARICWVDQPVVPEGANSELLIEARSDGAFFLLLQDRVSLQRTDGQILWTTILSHPIEVEFYSKWMMLYDGGVLLSQRGDPENSGDQGAEEMLDFWRLVRIDADGTELWSVRLGDVSDEFPFKGLPVHVPAAISPTGDIVLAWAYIGENPFEAREPGSPASKSAPRGTIETALAAFDADGQLLWTFDIEPPLLAEALVVKNDGTIVVAGPPTVPVWNDYYIMTAVSADGSQIWSHEVIEQSPMNDGDSLNVALYQGEGDTLYMVGKFYVEIELKDATGKSFVFTSPYRRYENGRGARANYFISQYGAGSDLSLNWARAGNSTDWDNAVSAHSSLIRKDDRGGIVLAGYLKGRVLFGPGEPNETVLIGKLLNGGFAARYNPDGTLDWARRIEILSASPSLSARFGPDSIALMPDGSITVVAEFKGNISFELADGTQKTVSSPVDKWAEVLVGLCAEPQR